MRTTAGGADRSEKQSRQGKRSRRSSKVARAQARTSHLALLPDDEARFAGVESRCQTPASRARVLPSPSASASAIQQPTIELAMPPAAQLRSSTYAEDIVKLTYQGKESYAVVTVSRCSACGPGRVASPSFSALPAASGRRICAREWHESYGSRREIGRAHV